MLSVLRPLVIAGGVLLPSDSLCPLPHLCPISSAQVIRLCFLEDLTCRIPFFVMCTWVLDIESRPLWWEELFCANDAEAVMALLVAWGPFHFDTGILRWG